MTVTIIFTAIEALPVKNLSFSWLRLMGMIESSTNNTLGPGEVLQKEKELIISIKDSHALRIKHITLKQLTSNSLENVIRLMEYNLCLLENFMELRVR